MPLALARSLRSSHRRALLGGTALIGVAASLMGLAGSARAQTAGAQTGGANNNIRIDGQTDTRLVVSGNKTDVFTNTIRSGNAFNSFSTFGVAQGNVVNLMVPDQAARLVNIVRDGPVNVQGVLNSYQNGVIGGRVVFADSYGMIVGASGVVNVGSLLIATPTKEVLDQMISGSVVNEALVGRVLRGDTPISPDGSVVIKGRINARDEVAITAMDVRVAGSLEGARKAAEHRAAFTATVNAEGWTGNGAIVSRNGKISIAAVGDVSVDGSLKAAEVSARAGGALALGASARIRANVGQGASGKVALSGDKVSLAGAIKAQGVAGVKGGRIDITSGRTIEIASTARVSVSGMGAQSDAGSIIIKAGTDLAVASGAQFLAAGGTSGDGGFVELSAKQTERLGAISVDLGAVQGKAGTLLLDPRDLVISGGAASANGASLSPNLVTNGGAVRLEADHSITIASDGLIDTRAQSGSGDITLIAPHLSVLAGGRLLASSVNGGRAGDVTLTATGTLTSGGASIAIGEAGAGKAAATIAGGRITLTATSEMLAVAHATIVIENAGVTASGALTAAATATGEMRMTTTPLTVAVTDVLASVDLLTGARITAASVDLRAIATATSNADAGMPKAFSAKADAAAAIVTTTSEARVRVAGDASVTSGGAVSLTAKNKVSSTATADATKGGEDASGASVAVNVVSATTQALVEEQATISADRLALSATSDVSATTTAKAAAKGAEKPQEDSQSSQYLNDKKRADGSSYADLAKTSEGKVSVAAALAIADFDATTTARMSSSNPSTLANEVTLASLAKNASSVLADGQTATGATGVGVGVALNIAKASTIAQVTQALEAKALSITALSDGAASENLFSASAVSGGGGGEGANIGVAGALGLNVLKLESAARIGSGAAVTLDGGDLEVKASNLATAKVSAKPAGEGVAAEKLGVGASVALNVVTTTTTAEIGDQASISKAGAVTVDAGATIDTETEAKGGAKGGTAVDAVVAISTLSQTTLARIGSGGLLTAAGTVSINADAQGENTATAESDASHTNPSGQTGGQGSPGAQDAGSGSGSGVAVGASIALITGSGSSSKTVDEAAGGKIDGSPVRTSTTTAELARDVSTPGAVKVSATQEHKYVAKSSATAGGASDEANDKSASQNTLKSDAAQKAMDKNQAALNENKGPDKGSQIPEKGGKLSVAAALGGVIVSDVVVANVVSALNDKRSLSANSLLVSATGKTKIQTLGNGSTTGEDNTGIGVGAALSIVLNDTYASIGDGSTVRSPGEVTVRAISGVNEGLGGLAAVAASGASGKNLSVAGALALALSDSRTRARVGHNSKVVGRRSDDNSQDLAAGDVSITAANTSQLGAKAWAGAYASGGTGIGASLVGVLSLDQYAALLGDSASIKAANLNVAATNVKVDDIFASLAPLLAAGQKKLDEINALITKARAATGGLNDAAKSESDKTKTAPTKDDDTKADGVSSARDKWTKALKELAETARDLPLLGANNYYTEALAGAASKDKLAIAGSLGVQVLLNKTSATIGANAQVAATGAVSVKATDETVSRSLVGGAGASLSGTAVGVSLGIVVNSGEVKGAIGREAIIAQSGAVAVNATAIQKIELYGAAAAAADANGVAGVIGVIASKMKVEASTGLHGAFTSTGAFTLEARNTIDILNVAGGLAAGGSNGVGGVGVATAISNDATALLASGAGADATSVNAGSIGVKATSGENIVNIGVAGSAAGTNAIAGVLTPLVEILNVSAKVGDHAALKAASGDVKVEASDSTTLLNLGGVLAIGGEIGVGGTVAASVITNKVTATIGQDAAIDAAGAVSVLATETESIKNIVVAGSASGEVAVSVAVGATVITDNTQASIGAGAVIGSAIRPAALTIKATDDTAILDIAGTFGASGSAGVGAGVDVVVLNKTTNAWFGKSSADEVVAVGHGARAQVAGDAIIQAASTQYVYSLVAGFGVGGDAGAAGSVSVYRLTGHTLAGVADRASLLAGGNVAVLAYDDSALNRFVGSVGVGGAAGVGASIGVTVMNQTTLASIGDNASVEGLGATNALDVRTDLAGVYADYGSDALAIKPPKKNDEQTGDAARATELSPTTVDAARDGASRLFTKQRTVAPVISKVKGVAVAASATNLIRAMAVGGAVGGSVGAGISADVPVVTGDTRATISAGAGVNTHSASGQNASQSVVVAASSDLYSLAIAGGAAGGGAAGLGLGAQVTVFDATTFAGIGAGASVKAKRDVAVTARAAQNIVSAGMSIGGGGAAGVGGSITGLGLTSHTHAFIGDRATVFASRDVMVAADDQTQIIMVAGGVTGGGAAGVGLSLGVAVVTKETLALVGDSANVTALGVWGVGDDFANTGAEAFTGVDFTSTQKSKGLLVQASSGQSLVSYILAGAGGGAAGVAGAVSVDVFTGQTRASIGDGAIVNGTNAGADAGQAVAVVARDSTVVAVVDGSLGGGLAGVAGAVDVAVLKQDTQATIGDRASINAAGDVRVAALSNRATDSKVASVSAGLGGAGVATSVLAVSNQLNAEQTDKAKLSDLSTDTNGKLSSDTIDAKFLSQSSNSDVKNISRAAQAKKGALAIPDLARASSAAGNSAEIKGATVRAGGQVLMQARDGLSARTDLGAALGAAGAGIGVGVAVVDLANRASIGAGANVRGDSVAVAATSLRAVHGLSVAGAAVGAGIAVASYSDTTRTHALVTGASVEAQGAMAVTADMRAADASTPMVYLTTVAAAGVGAAAGVNVSVLKMDTLAAIQNGSTVKAALGRQGSLNVEAINDLSQEILAVGVAGGVGGAGVSVIVEESHAVASIASSTVEAGVSTGPVGDVVVKAATHETLQASGFGLALVNGAGGAVSVLSRSQTTEASISGSTVTASGNAGVLANTTNDDALGLGAAGLGVGLGAGASVGVHVLSATTTARIDGASNVTALGRGADLAYTAGYRAQFTDYGAADKKPGVDGLGAAGAAVDRPVSQAEVSDAASKLLLQKRSALDVSGAARGVVVNAAGAESLRAWAVTAGVGVAGLAMSVQAPIVTMETAATIGAGAQINQRLADKAGALQSVVVASASDLHAVQLLGSVAGGTGGAGGSLGALIVNDTTTAEVGGRVSAKNNVLVSAKATEDFATIAAAGAAGGVGLAGGVSYVSLDNHTKALIGAGAEVVAGGNVIVSADDVTRSAVVAGAFAVGLAGGLGAGVDVITIKKEVLATIGDGAKVSGLANGVDEFDELTGEDVATTRKGRGVLVSADATQSLYNLTVAGAGAGGVALAGAISVQVVQTQTFATIAQNAVINGAAGAGAAQDVAVSARDRTGIVSKDGGFAVALGAGLAGAVDVGVIQSSVGATIAAQSVSAKHDVVVAAVADKQISSNVLSGSGGIVGLAASVSVYAIGDGIAGGGKADSELTTKDGGSLVGSAGQTISQGAVLGALISRTTSNGDAATIGNQANAKLNKVTVNANPTALASPGTTATISGVVTAGGAINVNGRDLVTHNARAGAVSAGAIGIGAGVTIFNDTASHKIEIASATLKAAQVAMSANSIHSVTLTGFAGGVGLVGAVEAAVAIASDTSTTRIWAHESSIDAASGAVNLAALAQRNLAVDAQGAAFAGVAAVGAAVAQASVDGEVSTKGRGLSITRSGSVALSAESLDTASATSAAAAGGLGGAGSGSTTLAHVAPSVAVDLDGGAIASEGLVRMDASARNGARAHAQGFAGAVGLSIGATLAAAELGASVGATVENGAAIMAGALQVESAFASQGVSAYASGSSGALVGVNATLATAKDWQSAQTSLSNSAIEATGAIVAQATGETHNATEAYGKVGGLIAAGANIANSSSATTTSAAITGMTRLAAGSIAVKADSQDNQSANAISGSGGVVAGAAATASTNDASTTSALLGAAATALVDLTQGDGTPRVTASHGSHFSGHVDTTQASLAGASGSRLSHGVSSTVTAAVDAGTRINARNLVIDASNVATRAIWNNGADWDVTSASGGFLNAAAARVETTVTLRTNAIIGAGTDIHLLAPGSGFNSADLRAYNNVDLHQRANLDAGGAIAIASSESVALVEQQATVAVGAGAKLFVDLGDIRMAAYGDATMDVDNVGSTYGAAGVLSGKATATLANQNFVTIGAEARIEATKYVLPQDYDHRPDHGTVSIYAGRALDGTAGVLNVSATGSLFNNTAIPISGAPDVQANVTSNAMVIIDTSTPKPGQRVGVTSAGDITIAADKGIVNTLARGEGTNIYLEGLEKAGSAISKFFGGGEVSLKMKSGVVKTGGYTLLSIDGNVEAGIQRTQTLVVTYGDTSGYKFTGEILPQLSGPYGQGATILKRLQDLQALKDQYAPDPIAVGAYQAEIVFLQKKLAAMGLATFDNAGAFQLNPGVTLGEVGTGPDQLLTAGLANFAKEVNPDLYTQVERYANNAIASWTVGGGGVSGVRTDLAIRYALKASNLAVLAAVNSPLAGAYQTAMQTLNGLIQSGDAATANVSTTLGYLQTATQTLTQTLTDLTQVLKANMGVNPKPPALNQALDGFFQNIIVGRTAVYQKAQDVKATVDQYIGVLTTIKAEVPELSANLDRAINFANLMNTGGMTAPDSDGQSVAVTGLYGTALEYGLRTAWLAGTLAPPDGVSVTTIAQWRNALVDAMNGKATVLPGAGPDASYHVIAPTVVAYMSNVNLTGQKVVSPKGTGRLAAPGDAVISIQNYTDASLELNDVVIPSFDVGKVRVNGVEVNSNADITMVTGVAANFRDANIVTAEKTGAPKISIETYYNPGNVAFYNPEGDKWWQRTSHAAPDIILNQNKLLRNNKGEVSINSDAGNIYLNGTIEGGSIRIIARNGDLVSSYVNGYNHVGGDPASQAPYGRQPLGMGMIANGDIYLSARYLNINSKVQSGIVDMALTITSETLLYAPAAQGGALLGLNQSQIDQYIREWREGDHTTLSRTVDLGDGFTLYRDNADSKIKFNIDVANGQLSSGTYSFDVPGDKPNMVGAAFDAAQKKIVVNATEVRGGRIQVYGQIINTTPEGASSSAEGTGQLNVLDGFGRINIDNQTKYALTLQTLDTGLDKDGTGRGTRGEIEITDVRLNANNPQQVDVVHTIYTRDYDPSSNGRGQVKIRQETGTLDQKTGAIISGGVNLSTVYGDGRSAWYQPFTGQKYVWQTAVTLVQITQYHNYSLDWFHNPDLGSFKTSEALDSKLLYQGEYRLKDGTFVSVDPTLADRTVRFPPYKAEGVFVRAEYSCNWWTLCIAQNADVWWNQITRSTEISTRVLKADNKIGINFIGQDRGEISVTSKSDITLNGPIKNVAGATTITADLYEPTNVVVDDFVNHRSVIIEGDPITSSIHQGASNPTIISRSIDLRATGSVGTLARPVNVHLTNPSLSSGSRSVSANADDGVVSVKAFGDLPVGVIKAAGDVNAGRGVAFLVAQGDIKARAAVSGFVSGADPDAEIRAPRVSLTSESGSIGSMVWNEFLGVYTGYTDDVSKRPLYGLSAKAAGDIYIATLARKLDASNPDGNILVNAVVSTGGDVKLAAWGRILDNNPVESVDARTYQQLVNYWNSLGLTAGVANDARKEAAISAYETSRTQAYRDYWSIRKSQSDQGAQFDPEFRVVYAVGSAQYHALATYYRDQRIAKNGGVTPADIDALVSADIQAQADGQTARYREWNAVYGGQAYNAAYAYKATDAEKATLTQGATWSENALGFSVAAGALKTITNTNPIIKDPNVSGRNVTLYSGAGIGDSKAATSINPTRDPGRDLTDAQKVALASAERNDLVLVLAGVRLPANASAAQRAAYDEAVRLGIQNTSTTIRLGLAEADMTAKERSALNAAALGLGFDVAGTHLEVGAKRPLNFAASGSVLANASRALDASKPDSGSIFLATRGDAAVAQLDAPGEVRLKALGSITGAAFAGQSVLRPINAGDLVLEAANGWIGSSTQGLRIASRAGGSITARAQNGVNLDIGDRDLNSGASGSNDAVIDTVYSPNGVTITAQGSILNANNDQLTNILGKSVTLTASTGSIGLASQTLNVGTTPDGSIAARAAGSIDIYAPASASAIFGDVTANNAVTLTAAGPMGFTGRVNAGGDVALTAGGRLHMGAASSVATPAGNVTVNADSMIMGDGASVGATSGSVHITTRGHAVLSRVSAGASGDGAILVNSGGDIVAAGDEARSFDLSASRGGVKVRAGSGIGDATWGSEALVPGANPLRIKSGRIDAQATTGDINLVMLDSVKAGDVTARAGSVDMDARSSFAMGTVSATGGDVKVVAQGDLGFSSLFASSSPGGAEGKIEASSLTGGISGGSASADGKLVLNAQRDIRSAGLGKSTNGLVLLSTVAGDIAWGHAESGATFTALALAGSIDLGSATSLGAQYLRAAQNIAFSNLLSSMGGVTANAVGGVLAGGSVMAMGDVSLTAHGGITSTGTAKSSSGAVSLLSTAGNVDWALVEAGGTFTARADAGSISLGSATSVGLQTLTAAQNIAFTQLTTTRDGVAANAGALLTGGSVDANRDVVLVSTGDNTGRTAISQTGSVTIVSTEGDIDWNRAQAATTFTATAPQGAVRLGEATSGGAMNVTAGTTITFDNLVTTGIPSDRGDMTLLSPNGRLQGGDISANGLLTIEARGIRFEDGNFNAVVGMDLFSHAEIEGTSLTSPGFIKTESMADTVIDRTRSTALWSASPASILIRDVTVSEEAHFAGNYVNVATVRHTPVDARRLILSLTGYKEKLGTSGRMYVDARNGIDVTRLREVDADVSTNARSVHVKEGVIDHTFRLTTPIQMHWMNNRTPHPLRMDDTQLYQPTKGFFLRVDDWATDTNSYVVQYWFEAAQIHDLLRGNYWLGASMVRDFDRQGRNGASGPLAIWRESQTPVRDGFPVHEFDRHLDRIRLKRVTASGNGPTVNLGLLAVARGGASSDAFRFAFSRR